MYALKYSSRFKKDIKKIVSGKSFDANIFNFVVKELLAGEKLHSRYKNHKLHGEFKDSYECHIKSDMLLVYRLDKSGSILHLLRIGSHSDLFG